MPPPDRIPDRVVLLVIAVGLILIVLSIIAGIFLSHVALPNWGENVLVSIATAAILKLGDCLSVLLSLANGKAVERLGNQLGSASPTSIPADAKQAADQVAGAAQAKADVIEGNANEPV